MYVFKQTFCHWQGATQCQFFSGVQPALIWTTDNKRLASECAKDSFE